MDLQKRVEQVIEWYVNNPAKFPLDVDILERYIATTNVVDREGLNVADLTTSYDENVYHVAARTNDVAAITLLHRLLPEKKRHHLLQMKKDVTAFQRFRGSLAGQCAHCLTPVHLAVRQWREKNGNEAVFKALLDGLTQRLKLEVLLSTDEKGRAPIGVAYESNIRQQKKDDMVAKIVAPLEVVRKEIDGKRVASENTLYHSPYSQIDLTKHLMQFYSITDFRSKD